jgi:hypothetical protein
LEGIGKALEFAQTLLAEALGSGFASFPIDDGAFGPAEEAGKFDAGHA